MTTNIIVPPPSDFMTIAQTLQSIMESENEKAQQQALDTLDLAIERHRAFVVTDIDHENGVITLGDERGWSGVERTTSDTKMADMRVDPDGAADVLSDIVEKLAPDDPMLADPRMDGKTWMGVLHVTWEAAKAWPVWEHRQAQGATSTVLSNISSEQYRRWSGSVRPLRLPGMDANGVVKAKDMTADHFARCAWVARHRHTSTDPWGSWNPCVQYTWDLSMAITPCFFV